MIPKHNKSRTSQKIRQNLSKKWDYYRAQIRIWAPKWSFHGIDLIQNLEFVIFVENSIASKEIRQLGSHWRRKNLGGQRDSSKVKKYITLAEDLSSVS